MSHAAATALCRAQKLQCELYPSRDVALCLDPYSGLGFVLWCLSRCAGVNYAFSLFFLSGPVTGLQPGHCSEACGGFSCVQLGPRGFLVLREGPMVDENRNGWGGDNFVHLTEFSEV